MARVCLAQMLLLWWASWRQAGGHAQPPPAGALSNELPFETKTQGSSRTRPYEKFLREAWQRSFFFSIRVGLLCYA